MPNDLTKKPINQFDSHFSISCFELFDLLFSDYDRIGALWALHQRQNDFRLLLRCFDSRSQWVVIARTVSRKDLENCSSVGSTCNRSSCISLKSFSRWDAVWINILIKMLAKEILCWWHFSQKKLSNACSFLSLSPPHRLLFRLNFSSFDLRHKHPSWGVINDETRTCQNIS